ncbi:MAG: D-glycero-beta-D-manno-heptose 1-phosphate adenylyltransferase [Desulfobacteraceae bacterium]|jgi:D-beta-D-heptose 7-phosphate kinase/D-beta-D-heptose 1-phosphate adenosyltransferase|nr:MAG: D-glycero-beta-D-manno-heptose 1-phosphate adenylyltransferase [Desulfobacteraceae bacterium]
MTPGRSKIRNLAEVKAICAGLKNNGKKIVFTNGCFDILHPGHVKYLEAAASLGDHLVVAINSDSSVRAIKGPARPVMDETSRAEVLAALGSVDTVMIFHEETPYNVIKELMPDILVKGGDWADEQIIGSDIVRHSGGRVERIPFLAGFSTSIIIERILERYGK